MTSMPFFSINVAGWIVATAGMTNEETGAFGRLLMVMAAASEHSLPDDDGRLARYAHCTPSRWKDLRPILAPMFVIQDGQWRHEWIEKEIAFIADKQAKRRHAAQVRWHAKPQENNNTDDAGASRMHVQTPMQNDATFTLTSPSQEESLSPSEREPAKPRRRKANTPFPDDDAFKLNCQQVCAETKPELDFESVFRRFRNHALQNDRQCRRWDPAWSNWIDKERENVQRRNPSEPSDRSTAAIAGFSKAARRP
jgi:uncharacterized protein YdaU (DUF1376 family)